MIPVQIYFGVLWKSEILAKFEIGPKKLLLYCKLGGSHKPIYIYVEVPGEEVTAV